MSLVDGTTVNPRAAAQLAWFAGALLLVALASMAGLLILPRWGAAPIVLLYLPAVLAAAVFGGLWPALLAAIAATLAYNYYFTAPYHTLMIHSPADIATVALLFLVGLVTSKLAGSLRDQARLAQAHAARNATIAGFARRLLSCADERTIAEVAVAELSGLFACNAALIVEGDATAPLASAPAGVKLDPSDLAAAAQTRATGQPAGRGTRRGEPADWQFRPVIAEQAVIAAMGIARADGGVLIGDDQVQLLDNLIDQVALALERARFEREANAVAALRERDLLRAALLASIGTDVKPRLNTIAAAARTLRRSDGCDKALAQSVSAEVGKVERYIDNLVELAPGADQTPIEAGQLTIDIFRRVVLRGGVEVHLTPKEFAVLAELAKHAGRVLTHAQLLRTVWGPAQQNHIEYLRVAIRALRQKLEARPDHPELILNEPSIGYRLVAG